VVKKQVEHSGFTDSYFLSFVSLTKNMLRHKLLIRKEIGGEKISGA
jgi:hypothetical protein